MEWVKVFDNDAQAREHILVDKPQLVVLYGKRICLTLHDNRFSAVQDACTHSGESLSKGKINYLGEIVCPLHNYRFDLQNGRECSSRSRDLITYPIKVDESGFFIGI
jgi:nitrite reductase/ring-hydroxylating ferredoxin subunit